MSWAAVQPWSSALQVNKAKPGTQQVKKAQNPIRKAFPAPRGTRSTAKYGKNEQKDQLWLPNTERPGWLDGSMPGWALNCLLHTLLHLACTTINTSGITALDATSQGNLSAATLGTACLSTSRADHA